jgi:hypothetical protein
MTTMLRDTWKSDAIIQVRNPFTTVFPTGMCGPAGIVWAGLTPFSFQSDCCDSVNTMVREVNPHTGAPVANTTEALGLAWPWAVLSLRRPSVYFALVTTIAIQ